MFNKNRIKESFGDRVLLGIIYLLLSAIMLTVLYPLIYIISSSFSSPQRGRFRPGLAVSG